MAGDKSEEPEEILLVDVSHDGYLECCHYLVDLECFGPRGGQCFFGQQPDHVFSLAGLSGHKKMVGGKIRLCFTGSILDVL